MIKLKDGVWYKIKCSSEQEGYSIQEKLFEIGCHWNFDSCRLRKVKSGFHIGITPDKIIYMDEFSFNLSDSKELKITDLF